MVFATFDPDVGAVREFVGPEIGRYFDRIFDGRSWLLGYSRQRIPGNWKLMMENIKDPYHPGLLHTWFVTFGLWRADQQSLDGARRARPPCRDGLAPERRPK